jgi:molybdopterin/thiamine biosynthesis adenylyltransferase
MNLRERIFFDRMLRIPWIRKGLLEELRVAVVGLGNTGSYTAVMLYGLGLKELWLIDKDEVELPNIQRQFIYPETSLGRPKAECAREFLLSRFSGLKTRIKAVIADIRYFTGFDFDFVFCCVDNNSARKAVLESCLEKRIPLIDMGLEFHESQSGHVILVDRERFPEGACVNCYMDLSRDNHRGGCIAAGIPYSGAAVASAAIGMFLHHLMKPKRVNYYFIDFNSADSRFMFLKRRGSCEVCGNE